MVGLAVCLTENEARDRIIDLFGDLPRIELFCRHPEQGWDSMGNELTEEKLTEQQRTRLRK